jgi:ABC-2 type transport system ATP-binding protein
MTNSVIQVEGLTKLYGELAAVDGVGFEVVPGSTCGLLGGNGAGKTTTIAMLLGLLLPTAGRIRMNFSSPYVDLPHRLTVGENLSVYARLYGVRERESRIRRLADDLDIAEFLKRSYGNLSAGQKTRVALAKALLNEPELLLLDEPTASLDPDTADRIRGYLNGYKTRAGATILLASHNMLEVERLCSDVIMMRAGRIIDRGTPEWLLQLYGRANLEEVFLDIARDRRHGSTGARAGADA